MPKQRAKGIFFFKQIDLGTLIQRGYNIREKYMCENRIHPGLSLFFPSFFLHVFVVSPPHLPSLLSPLTAKTL